MPLHNLCNAHEDIYVHSESLPKIVLQINQIIRKVILDKFDMLLCHVAIHATTVELRTASLLSLE